MQLGAMASTHSLFLPTPFRALWAPEADTLPWTAAAADIDARAAVHPPAQRFDGADDMTLSLSLPVPSASLSPRGWGSDIWASDGEGAGQAAHPRPPRERQSLLSPQLQPRLDAWTPVLALPGLEGCATSTSTPIAAAAAAAAAPASSPVPAARWSLPHPPDVLAVPPAASVWSSMGLAVGASPFPPPASSAKKAKHRAIDAKRRNLEAEAMHALQQLVMGPVSSFAATAAASASTASAGVPAMPAASASPVPKVSVLQACADYIRHLQAEVQRLQSSASASDSSASSVSSQRKRIRIDPQAALDELSHVEESRVLRNEMFVSASVLLCCMDLTGRWIDVNQRWLQRMCWSRDDVLGRFGSPIAAYMPFITQHPQAQMTFPAADLVRIKGGCSKGFEYVQHDATTISHLRSLYQQQKQVIEFVDGFVMGCSKFIEIRWSCWLVVHDGQPRYFYLSAPDSAIVHVTCTSQQAKQLAAQRTAESAAATPPLHQRMEQSLSSAAAASSCTCSHAAGCAPSCAHCTAGCSSCSPSACGPSSPLSPWHSTRSSASSLDSSACQCCARGSCNTTAPCACVPSRKH